MKRLLWTATALALAVSSAFAQAKRATPTVSPTYPTRAPHASASEPLVEFEMMTWPEVKKALEAGKTTALVYTGGTEQRGPQNVNGGHNLMGREIVRTVALKLGNAIAMPVLPYTPNNASADRQGTVDLTPAILGIALE